MIKQIERKVFEKTKAAPILIGMRKDRVLPEVNFTVVPSFSYRY